MRSESKFKVLVFETQSRVDVMGMVGKRQRGIWHSDFRKRVLNYEVDTRQDAEKTPLSGV